MPFKKEKSVKGLIPCLKTYEWSYKNVSYNNS